MVLPRVTPTAQRRAAATVRLPAGRGWRVWVTAAMATCLAGCASSTSYPPGPGETARDGTLTAPPAVEFDFEDMIDGPRPQAPNMGSLGGAVTSLVANGGKLGPVAGPDGQSVRFPVFDASPEAGRAALVYEVPAGGLDTGGGDFRFGVDFALDDVTQGGEDDGNNLVQRGLSADPVQFKVQADGDRASCRVAGDEGSVIVISEVALEPHVWYRVVCSRQGRRVTLDLARTTGQHVDSVVEEASIGSLDFDPSVPLVMGGKVTADRAVVQRKADQFNGVLDNVFVDVG